METHVYGSMATEGREIIRREGRLYVRYDAGAHFPRWREDEITEEEYKGISADAGGSNRTLLKIQRRLEEAGTDPYRSNWVPG